MISAASTRLALLTPLEMAEADRLTIESGIPGYTLMMSAGEAVFKACRSRWPDARKIAIVCGPGNNGGDGFVIARLASAAGLDVKLGLLGDTGNLTGDARLAAIG